MSSKSIKSSKGGGSFSVNFKNFERKFSSFLIFLTENLEGIQKVTIQQQNVYDPIHNKKNILHKISMKLFFLQTFIIRILLTEKGGKRILN